MIVGTAGHIDHGKTTLVRALTGIDTDRLPEEKARGISIELGYAFIDVPGVGDAPAAERIGFVDVPGHERLVHTMIAGATGIDLALLLVAADDGVMPQTREHLAVLSLLGLARGIVAITKIDRVEASRIEQVRSEIAELLAATTWAASPVIAVSATTGEGVAPLREALFEAARSRPAVPDDGRAFRLAIDRVFTLAGIGAVVTGTVHAGRVTIGDELALSPSPGGLHARVRSLHAQNQAVELAHAGQRCAIGLVGIAKEQIARGQWLTAPAIALSTDRLDARIRLWPGEAKALRSGTKVHLHLGASDVLASVAVLSVDGDDGRVGGGDAVAPGHEAIVQLVLRAPVGAWRGDRLVLRDACAGRTLAGGRVLDPFAPARYRRSPPRRAELVALSAGDAATRLRQLLAVANTGLSIARWAQAEGLADGRIAEQALGSDVAAGAGDWALAPTHRDTIGTAALQSLRAFHGREPEMLGPDAARLRRLVAPRLPEALWQSVLAALQRQGRIALRGAFLHLPEHGLALSAIDARLAQKIAPVLATAGVEGAWARDLAKDARESEVLMRTTLARLAQRGELHQIVKDLCYDLPTIGRLAAIVRRIAATQGGAVTAAGFRDATGLGRKRAIQLLEYFDRVGLLRRVGDAHRLRADSHLFETEARTATL